MARKERVREKRIDIQLYMRAYILTSKGEGGRERRGKTEERVLRERGGGNEESARKRRNEVAGKGMAGACEREGVMREERSGGRVSECNKRARERGKESASNL